MTQTPEFKRSLDYLFSHIDNSKTHASNLAPENFDLSRVRALMASLGDPHTAYPVIHIAGTKGKGSVAAFCASALQTAGYRVGLYTSPHLQTYTERFQINGVPMAERDFITLVEKMKPHVARIPALTVFEIEAALAFWHFARCNVDFGVIEVGMGGRLDATNVVTPLVSVITAISLDHTQILGTSIAEIAAEKAGIIKEGCPVVVAPQPFDGGGLPPGPARQTVARIARQCGAPLLQVGVDNRYFPVNHSTSSQRFTIQEGDRTIELQIPLLGRHQMENAATAFAALRVVQREGLPLQDAEIQEGFARTRWPGRFEILGENPQIVIDAAHNPDSARRLSETLEQIFPGREGILVIGVMSDKNITGMLTELRPHLEHVVATQADHPRALPAENLAALAGELGLEAEVTLDVASALDLALRSCPPEGLILVTGSLYVAGEARSILKE